jgi:hypothetical protein
VSFDNIAQSMELVFVIMSTNTFTDLMFFPCQHVTDHRYYSIDAEHMVASLCISSRNNANIDFIIGSVMVAAC